MRTLPIAVALVLICSGLLAVIYPRPLVVGHASYGNRGFAVQLSRLENVSKEGCRNYGLLAILAGAFMIWGALAGSYVPLTDRRIARSIVETKKRLEASYGITTSCTIAQIEAAIKASKISSKHLPYLCATFMGRDEFDQLRILIPDVDWDRIEIRVSRIACELPYRELNGSHFHETWIPTVDNKCHEYHTV